MNIQNHSVVNGPHVFHPHYVDILHTKGAELQWTLQVQLVPPCILASSDSVSMQITVIVLIPH